MMMRRALFSFSRLNFPRTLTATKSPLSVAATKASTKQHYSTSRETLIANNGRSFSSKTHDEFTEEAEKTKKKIEQDRKMADEEEHLKMKILDAALDKVPELGWTSEALHAGAESAGYQSVTAGLIQDGPVDLIKRHMEVCDAKLEDLMLKEVEAKKAEGDRVRVRPFCRKMVEVRLRMNSDLIKSGRWAEAVAMMAKPDVFPGYLESELRLMDAIWHHCDLNPTNDINWYTKRISLAVMYKSTELFMLEDDSPDFSDTWAFLDRRFEDELNIAMFLMGSRESRKVIQGVFNTIQNMVGVNRK